MHLSTELKVEYSQHMKECKNGWSESLEVFTNYIVVTVKCIAYSTHQSL